MSKSQCPWFWFLLYWNPHLPREAWKRLSSSPQRRAWTIFAISSYHHLCHKRGKCLLYSTGTVDRVLLFADYFGYSIDELMLRNKPAMGLCKQLSTLSKMLKSLSASGVSLRRLKRSAYNIERAWLNLSFVNWPFVEQFLKASRMNRSICSFSLVLFWFWFWLPFCWLVFRLLVAPMFAVLGSC